MRAYRRVDDHYEFRVDGGRLAFLGVGAALVVLLVFLLGVLVGKTLWGGRRQIPPLPVANSAAPATDSVRPPEKPDPEPPRPKYTFYEELKKPDPLPSPAPQTAPPQPTVRAQPERPPAPTSPVAPAPAPVPKAEPAPASRPPAAVFTVQVGSFRDREAAVTLAKRVADQGVSAGVSEAFVAGRTWYRVQVGRFETRSDAETYYRKRLRAKGVQGFVTTR
jgi:cell division protein FtsN